MMNRTCREAAMVYDPKGTGFLIGPTGPPEAFTDLDFKDGGIKSSSNMDGVLVKAGQSRRGEPMMICFDSPETASKIWTRWVAATHGARLHRERVYGWCSWYSRTTNIDEKHTRDVLGDTGGQCAFSFIFAIEEQAFGMGEESFKFISSNF